MIICKSCGTKNSDGREFCRVCGERFNISEFKTPESAKNKSISFDEENVNSDRKPSDSIVNYNIQRNRNFFGASSCFEYDESISPLSRWLAFLLCALFGAIGLHRFYTGKIGTGILYIFTFGLLGIGILVDLILITMGKFKDKSDLLLKE